MSSLMSTLKQLKNSTLQKYKIRRISEQYSDMMEPVVTASRTQAPRLNIVLPSIASQHTFGGVATALRFFHALAPAFASARIIAMYDTPAAFEPQLWTGWTRADDAEGKSIALLHGNHQPTIAVSEQDVFIATEYRTAYLCRQILKERADAGLRQKPLIYFIQDFEPLFFPWSSRYLLADSTYRSAQPTVAVFNTRLLADYFANEGYQFASNYAFEPKINAKIATWLPPAASTVSKRKKILIYGRPGTHRNAFEILVLALKLWAARYPDSAQWEIESLGEHHEPIPLPNQRAIVSRGKLSLEQYAGTLREAALGVSLMVSPHPSYPPLEMAAFGLGVLTNHFRNKNLSTLHESINSLEAATPQHVAAALQEMCEAFSQDQTRFQRGKFIDYDFLEPGDEFPFVQQLLADVGADTGKPLHQD